MYRYHWAGTLEQIRILATVGTHGSPDGCWFNDYQVRIL